MELKNADARVLLNNTLIVSQS